jgi:hypothetical protein
MAHGGKLHGLQGIEHEDEEEDEGRGLKGSGGRNLFAKFGMNTTVLRRPKPRAERR